MNNPPHNDLQPASEPVSGPARALAIAANKAAYWVSRHWLFLFNLIIATYIALPFAAPILMMNGWERPARMLYTIYSPACHQLSFRSYFIGGEQSYYPLEETGIPHVHYFQEYMADDPAFANYTLPEDFGYYVRPAARFVGNQQMGYKVALCQRDVAMYLSILAGGVLFGFLRNRLKPLRWQFFVLIGILPMLFDGGYQLLTWQLGVFANIASAPAWLHDIAIPLSQTFAPHETIPLLRVFTGSLFGLGLVWMTYPHIHEGMQDTEKGFQEKLVRAEIIQAPQ